MLWGPSGFYLVTTGLAHLAQMGQPISCPLGPFGPDGSQIGPMWGPAICTRVIEGPQMGGPDCTHLAQMGPRETQMYPTIGPSIYTRVTYWAPDGPYVGFMWDLPHSIYGSSGFYMGPIWAISGFLYGIHMGQVGLIWSHMGQCGFKWASYCLNGFLFFRVEFIYPISISRVTSWV